MCPVVTNNFLATNKTFRAFNSRDNLTTAGEEGIQQNHDPASKPNINNTRRGDDEIQVVPVDNTAHVEKVTLTPLKRLDLVSGNIFESTGSVRRKVTVRLKILVRRRNLVIFEGFGVKFSAKKSIFRNCLENLFFGRKISLQKNFTQKTSKMTNFRPQNF